MFFDIEHIAVDYDRRALSLTDNPTPIFTWAARCARDGAYQSSYSLTVKNRGNTVWESGEVKTRAQRACYAGAPLLSGEYYTVALTIKDDQGNESAAKSADFRYLGEKIWVAKWITTGTAREKNAKYFYKGFTLTDLPVNDTIYACGLGYQYLSVNGEDVERSYLNPAISQYNKLAYYTVTDVTHALRIGKNGLFAIVGDGWRDMKDFFARERQLPSDKILFGDTQLIAELVLEYADGSRQVIATGEDWLAGYGAITENSVFHGETYDARMALPLWDTPNFEGEELSPAVPATGVVGELHPQTHPPVTEQERLRAKVIRRLSDGSYIYDFGVNIAGACQLTLPKGLPTGTEIRIEHTEELLPNGDLDKETLRRALVTDRLITGDTYPTTWVPRLTYHGFRYAKISGLPTAADEETLVAIVLCNDVKSRSFFRCGDPLINQLQENIVRTEMDNLHHIATDCPQRDERMGWMNDATVRFEETPYNFHMGRMFPKILRDMIIDQDPETGTITDTAPRVWSGIPADPVCSSFLIAGLEMLLHYGDIETIRACYEPYKRWNACLASLRNEEGIVNYTHYGDWASPADFCVEMTDGKHSLVTPGTLMSTGYHYYNYKLLARFAALLGKTEEEAEHLQQAKAVQKAFLKKWCMTTNEVDRGLVHNGSQGAQAFALWTGILPKEYEKQAARWMRDAVRRVGHRLTTGNLTYRYLLDMLVKHGYTDDAWKLVSRKEYPSWGYTIQNGATTIWERFECKRGSDMNSHCHPMYGAVGYWFYAHLLGVTPIEGGWSRFAVKPCFPTELLYAEGKIDTLMGDIYVRWQHQMESIDVLVDVPFGTTAVLTLPSGTYELTSGCHSFSFEAEN